MTTIAENLASLVTEKTTPTNSVANNGQCITQNLAGTAQDNTWSYTRNQVQDIKAASWTNNSYQWTGYTNGTRSYTANGLNQYATAAGSTLSYDANGNLGGDGVWTWGDRKDSFVNE